MSKKVTIGIITALSMLLETTSIFAQTTDYTITIQDSVVSLAVNSDLGNTAQNGATIQKNTVATNILTDDVSFTNDGNVPIQVTAKLNAPQSGMTYGTNDTPNTAQISFYLHDGWVEDRYLNNTSDQVIYSTLNAGVTKNKTLDVYLGPNPTTGTHKYSITYTATQIN